MRPEQIADFKEQYLRAIAEYVAAAERHSAAASERRAALAKLHRLERDVIEVLTGVGRSVKSTDKEHEDPHVALDMPTYKRALELLAKEIP